MYFCKMIRLLHPFTVYTALASLACARYFGELFWDTVFGSNFGEQLWGIAMGSNSRLCNSIGDQKL